MTNKTVEPHKSSLGGLDANIAAFLVYIVAAVLTLIPGLRYFSWAVPLVVYFIETQSEFVRFHAIQSFVINAISAIVSFIINVIIRNIFFAAVYSPYSLFGAFGAFGIFSFISGVIGIAILVFAIIAMVQSYKYVEYHIPLINPIIQKISSILGKK